MLRRGLNSDRLSSGGSPIQGVSGVCAGRQLVQALLLLGLAGSPQQSQHRLRSVVLQAACGLSELLDHSSGTQRRGSMLTDDAATVLLGASCFASADSQRAEPPKQ